MTSKRTIQAPTLEDALAQAASALGIHEDDVHYRLIDEGRKGVMGIGQRDVRIEIELHEQPPPSPEAVPAERPRGADPSAAVPPTAAPAAATADPVQEDEDRRGNLKQPPARRSERRSEERSGGRRERRSGGGDGRRREGGRRGRSRRGRRGGDQRERPAASRPVEDGPPKEIAPEALQHFLGEIQQLLDLMTFELTARVEATPSGVRVELEGEDLDRVRGRDNEFQFALQFLLNRMSRRAFPEVGRIQVGRDGGRRSERDEELIAEIREVAGQVQRTGMAKKLHPMNPYERRLVHLTVREFEGLETRSDGDGFLKTITVTRS